MYVLHSKWFSSYSQISQVLWFVTFLLSASISCKSRRKPSALCPTSWSTTLILDFYYLSYVWYSLPVIIDSWRVKFIVLNLSLWDRFYLSVRKSVIYSSCVVTTMLWLLNVLVEVKSMVISLLWSVTLVSLIHYNILRECCSLEDQGVPEGMHHQPSSDLPHLM